MHILDDLQRNVTPENCLIFAQFKGDPHDTEDKFKWQTKALPTESDGNLRKSHMVYAGGKGYNTYTCVSQFPRPGESGLVQSVTRTRPRAAGLLCVMLDDIGTKIPHDKIPVEPNWVIETSEGNHQYVYTLDHALTNKVVAENLLGAFAEAGFMDPGCHDVTRLFRLPGGVNGKKGAGNWLVTSKHLDKNPWSVEELVKEFGLDSAVALSDKPGVFSNSLPDSALVTGDASEWKANLFDDSLGKWLLDTDRLQEPPRPNGWINIECPWGDEHTGGDLSGTAYLPAIYSTSEKRLGGFKCNHSSCEGRTVIDFRDWARENGWEGTEYDKQQAEKPAGAKRKKSTKKEGAPKREGVKLIDEGELFDRFVLIAGNGEQCVRDRRTKQHITLRRLTEYHGSVERTNAKGSTYYAAAGEALQEEERGMRADMETWAPGRDEFFTRQKTRYYNTWKDPKIAASPIRPEPWLNHLQTIYPAGAEHVTKWLAFMMQRPGEKINHALFFGGIPGSGKDSLLVPFARHERYRESVGMTDIGQLYGQFDEWCYQKKLVVLQEAMKGNSFVKDSRQLHNRLKPFLTAPPDMLTLNLKFKSATVVDNVVSMIIMSNHKDGIHVEEGERRYYALWTDTKPSIEHFEKLYAYYDNGGVEQVLSYLMGVDLTGWSPHAAPRATEMLQELKESSRSPLAEQLNARLEGHDLVVFGKIGEYLNAGLPAGGKTVTVNAVRKALNDLGWINAKNPGEAKGRWMVRPGTKATIYKRPLSEVEDDKIAAFAAADIDFPSEFKQV